MKPINEFFFYCPMLKKARDSEVARMKLQYSHLAPFKRKAFSTKEVWSSNGKDIFSIELHQPSDDLGGFIVTQLEKQVSK